MASRPLIKPQQVITNGSMTGTTAIHSQVTILTNLTQVGYMVSWTGTPNGTFSVEVSNDYSENADGSVRNTGTWTAVTLTGSPVASGSSGHGFINLDSIAAYAMRLTYTNASSTGTLQAYVSAKVA